MVIRSSYFRILAEKSLGDVGGVPGSDSFLINIWGLSNCCRLLFLSTSHPTNPQGDCPLALVVHAPTDTQGELDDREDQQAK